MRKYVAPVLAGFLTFGVSGTALARGPIGLDSKLEILVQEERSNKFVNEGFEVFERQESIGGFDGTPSEVEILFYINKAKTIAYKEVIFHGIDGIDRRLYLFFSEDKYRDVFTLTEECIGLNPRVSLYSVTNKLPISTPLETLYKTHKKTLENHKLIKEILILSEKTVKEKFRMRRR